MSDMTENETSPDFPVMDEVLAALTDAQRKCGHRLMTPPAGRLQSCLTCGLTASKTIFRGLRRLGSGKMILWFEGQLTLGQAACEEYGHRHPIEHVGYARVGAKRFPHSIGKCKGCQTRRPMAQFEEIKAKHRRMAARNREVEQQAGYAEPKTEPAGLAVVAHAPGYRGKRMSW